MLQKISARQNSSISGCRKFLQGKIASVQVAENFCRIKAPKKSPQTP